MRIHFVPTLFTSLCISLCATFSSNAQTVWTDATGNWFTPGNWTPSGPPTAGDDAQINNGGTAQIGAAGAVAKTLALGFDAANSGTVSVSGAGTLTTGFLTVGESGIGTLNITNGGAVSNTAAASIGVLAGSAGSSVTVNGPGSTWTNSGFITVATFGSATLDITNGGKVSNTFGIVGYLSTATATVDGAGSTWTNTSSLNIGQNVTGGDIGTLNITNGGKVSNTSSNVGTFTGAIGIVNVDGTGSMWTNNGDLTLASFGTATLNIRNGGAVSNTNGFVAGNPGDGGPSEKSVATANVTGTGSTWTNTANLYVGELGNGTLHIASGGKVLNVDGRVGDLAGSTGLVTVDGVGSMWTNSGGLRVREQRHGRAANHKWRRRFR